MANCSESTNKATAKTISLPMPDGQVFKFKFADNLKGAWQGADANKVYFGLVPQDANGKEHLEWSLLLGDLLRTTVTAIDENGKLHTADFSDACVLRKKAKELALSASTDKELFEKLATAFPNGLKTSVYEYIGINKSNGKFAGKRTIFVEA